MMGVEVTDHMHKSYQKFKNVAFVDFCHYITGGYNDCNDSKVRSKDGTAVERNGNNFEYTRENILSFVNSLGASFDEVVILPDLAGYRVHKDGGGYNFADEFYYDVPRTVQAQKIKEYFYNYEKQVLGKRYPNFSIYFDNDVLKVLLHYNRLNDVVEIPDVFKYGFDYAKPAGATVVR